MISTPSRLTERHRTLVLDASVVINLLGSGRPADVLRLLGRQTVVEERALAEVRRDPSNGRPAQEALNALQMAGLIRCERLSRQGYLSFLALTGAAPPDDLDDGEAATIAHADDIAATPVLDDKKAARICVARRPDRAVLTTVDLLCSVELLSGLPSAELADLIFATLRNARMRVAPPLRPWVWALIGEDRGRTCPSLGKP
jgi:predicted nucleic acid-binding protein